MCLSQAVQNILAEDPRIEDIALMMCYDADTLSAFQEFLLSNCCQAIDEQNQLYAVGSMGQADLLDSRTLQVVRKIQFENPDCVSRSVCFNVGFLAIGTDQGSLPFWDGRADKVLQSAMNSMKSDITGCCLFAGCGATDRRWRVTQWKKMQINYKQTKNIGILHRYSVYKRNKIVNLT